MWFIVKILWTNYMWFIVRILWTWNLFFTLLEISKPLFFSIFGNAIITIVKKKKIYSPISAMTLLRLPFFYFKSTLHSGTLGHTAFGQENWAVEFRQSHCRNSTFSLSLFSLLLFPFPYSLSCFLAEFWQCHCRNSVSLLIFPIIFEQFV